MIHLSLGDALGVAGVILGIAGFVAGALGVVYAKAGPRPVFKQGGNRVVLASKEQKISVQYDGIDVPAVSRTVISFWNAGRKTLLGSAVVEDRPVRFEFEEARI